ncbi:MAG TPA: molecular chaperone TorD family protein [Pyrinomonadaceae bacterium]|jgi:TorA maturation chaperone TorD
MELFRALAVLAEPPSEQVAPLAEALDLGALPEASEYTELFVFQLYPYASVYLGAEGMLGGEARDRVAGFWRALGQTPPPEPDHLSVMLALYARLSDFEEREGDARRRESWRHARRAFLWEHLLSWLPVYLKKLSEVASPFYRGWGELLTRALLEESKTLEMQTPLPMALRDGRRLADPRSAEADEFRQTLLSPARSGMILTRSDLARAARKLGLGLRAGERKFVLQSLFDQDAKAVLGWLRDEATLWTNQHREQRPTLGQIAEAWEERARSSATLLAELEAAIKTNDECGMMNDE